jgi:hypothetical protein
MKRTRLRRKKRLTRIKPRPITDKELDAACRAVVFERDGYRCRKSGKTTLLQWAHVYSRRYKSVRWDPRNSMVLTAGEHLLWHSQPIAAAQWWLGEVGEEFHRKLRDKMLAGERVDRAATLAWLKAELKRLQGGRHAS